MFLQKYFCLFISHCLGIYKCVSVKNLGLRKLSYKFYSAVVMRQIEVIYQQSINKTKLSGRVDPNYIIDV